MAGFELDFSSGRLDVGGADQNPVADVDAGHIFSALGDGKFGGWFWQRRGGRRWSGSEHAQRRGRCERSPIGGDQLNLGGAFPAAVERERLGRHEVGRVLLVRSPLTGDARSGAQVDGAELELRVAGRCHADRHIDRFADRY